ncbi:hypothetical protein TBK1r_52130 [Stieleria magnilauensis]|uniref:Uncharacterized protein n=1 Tax=Stieleria magnilauensis TaxID=2527963 RepID=A0ABX5XXM1_9BACT|nr:hypothetical protein TBK1r_52130 [Planctomycetes bacterium TBK1r]
MAFRLGNTGPGSTRRFRGLGKHLSCSVFFVTFFRNAGCKSSSVAPHMGNCGASAWTRVKPWTPSTMKFGWTTTYTLT